MLSNRSTKSLAFIRVFDHDAQSPARDAQSLGGNGQSFDFKVSHHVKRALANLAQHIFRRNKDPFENEFCRKRRSHPELVHPFLTQTKARHALLDNEG